MKNILKKQNVICVTIIVFVFALSMLLENEKKTITTSSSVIDNKKIEWGIKRAENHEQPDLGENNRKILEDNNGIALGNSEKKYIYLTFDLGYEAGYTKRILNSLKENNVKAAFFITGHYLNTASDLVKRMIDEGHIVGNHTVNHKSMPDLSDEEIKKEVMDLHQIMNEKFGYEMKYIRPPMGEFSEKTIKMTNQLGYKTVMWSFAYEDWNENDQPDEEKSLEKIVNNFHNGEILLLHGNSKTNMNILDKVIKKAREMEYVILSLDEFEK